MKTNLRWFFLRIRNVSDEADLIETHILCLKKCFPKRRASYDVVWENIYCTARGAT